MHNGLKSKVKLDDAISSGQNIASTETLIQPYNTGQNGYDPSSSKLIIDTTVRKIEQNLKAEQFGLGPTFLLVDLADQLPLNSSPLEACLEFFPCDGQPVSGVLWHIAFGILDKDIFSYPDHPKVPRVDGKQERNGILMEYPYIKGLIFCTNREFYSFALNQKEFFDPNIGKLLRYISAEHIEI